MQTSDQSSGWVTMITVAVVVFIGIYLASTFDAPAQTPDGELTLEEVFEGAPNGVRLCASGRTDAHKGLSETSQKALEKNFNNYLEACMIARTDADIDQALARYERGMLRIMWGTEKAFQYQEDFYDKYEAYDK